MPAFAQEVEEDVEDYGITAAQREAIAGYMILYKESMIEGAKYHMKANSAEMAGQAFSLGAISMLSLTLANTNTKTSNGGRVAGTVIFSLGVIICQIIKYDSRQKALKAKMEAYRMVEYVAEEIEK